MSKQQQSQNVSLPEEEAAHGGHAQNPALRMQDTHGNQAIQEMIGKTAPAINTVRMMEGLGGGAGIPGLGPYVAPFALHGAVQNLSRSREEFAQGDWAEGTVSSLAGSGGLLAGGSTIASGIPAVATAVPGLAAGGAAGAGMATGIALGRGANDFTKRENGMSLSEITHMAGQTAGDFVEGQVQDSALAKAMTSVGAGELATETAHLAGMGGYAAGMIGSSLGFVPAAAVMGGGELIQDATSFVSGMLGGDEKQGD